MFFSRKRQRRTSAEFSEYIQRIGLEEYQKRQRYAMIRRHILRALVCPMTRSQLFAHLEINPSYGEFCEVFDELESLEFIIVSPSTDEVFGRAGEYGGAFDMVRRSDELRTLAAT